MQTYIYVGCMTHQYGVPMKESLLCKVLVFLADTPKSAESRKNIMIHLISASNHTTVRHFLYSEFMCRRCKIFIYAYKICHIFTTETVIDFSLNQATTSFQIWPHNWAEKPSVSFSYCNTLKSPLSFPAALSFVKLFQNALFFSLCLQYVHI